MVGDGGYYLTLINAYTKYSFQLSIFTLAFKLREQNQPLIQMTKTRRNLAAIFILSCASFAGYAQQPKLVIPAGNTGRIDHMQFSPDARNLITTFGSDEIILWTIPNKQVYNKYRLPGRITSALIFPSGKTIAGSSTNGSLGFWDYLGKDSARIKNNREAISSMDITPGGRQIVSCNTDTTLTVYDVFQDKVIFHRNTGDPLDNVKVSHRGDLAVFGDRAGKIYLLNLNSKEAEFYNKVCDGPVRDLKFNPNDSLLAAGDGKGNIYLINLQPFKVIYSIKAFSSQAFSVSFYKNLIIATGRDNARNLKFFRLADGKEENYLPLFHENENSPSFLYGIYSHALSSDGLLAVPNADGSVDCWNLESKRLDFTLNGDSAPIYDIESDGNGLVYFATENKAGVYDLQGISDRSKIFSSSNPFLQVSQGSGKVAVLGSDTLISLLTVKGELISSFRANSEVFNAPVRLLNDGRVIYRSSPSTLVLRDLKSRKIKIIKIDNCYDYKLSASGTRLVALSNKNSIRIWDRMKWKNIKNISAPDLKAFDINESGTELAGIYLNGNRPVIRLVQLDDYKVISEIAVPDSVNIDRVYLINDSQTLLTISRTSLKFNQGEDYSIRVWDLKNDKYSGRLTGHTALVSDVIPFNNNTVISASMDGTMRLWSLLSNREIASIVPFKNGEWVVINPRGIFDASPLAMPRLHFILDNEEISLNQLKENFYEPKMLQKLLGYSDEPFIVNPAASGYHLYPEIRFVPPDFNDGILTASFGDQGGGIGKISVLINGKEAIEDARQMHGYDSVHQSFNYPVNGHPFLKPGSLNKVSVVVYNKYGYKISNEKSIYLLSDLKGGASGNPDLYAIIIGISDYKGSDIDLTFAAKDAEDFANAIQLGAIKYLGKDHVFIHRLTTLKKDSLSWPGKRNIEQTFTELAGKAQPKDILLVYISGHGVDDTENNEFYFLTADADSRTANDPLARPGVGLSSSSLVRLIKQVPALKQLMIVDACHSGDIVSGLGGQADLNSGSIRALEKVKDRTGMYILASSEGQDVSYESSLFDQGLLTYSLLFGLKGAGLQEGEMADVVSLLQFVNGNVPVLAEDIGKEQKPVIKIPDDISSFDIGKMTTEEKDKIQIKSPKPIVARSNFQNQVTFNDDLQIGALVDARMKDYRDLLKNKFIFLDENSFNNAIQVFGRYQQGKNILTVNYRVFKNNILIREETLTAETPENLAKAIAEKIMVVIDQQK